jgi:four helix bundle protein
MTIERRTSNVERSTSNGQRKTMHGFDLEERLREYAARICRLTQKMSQTRAGNHVAKQLLRSGTSALPNPAEAQAAESREDFLHKMRVCLKELRETKR